MILLLLAAFEATLVSLFSTLVGLGPPWPLLFAVVLVGRCADWLTTRLPVQSERLVLLGGALVAVLLLVGSSEGLGLVALLPGSDRFGVAYLVVLVALFSYWRGTQLTSADSSSVSNHFGRSGTVLGVLLFALAPFFGSNAERSSAITAHLLAYVALGLLSMAALTSSGEQTSARSMGWRWFATLAVSVAVVLAGSGLFVALLGGREGLAALQQLVTILLMPIAMVGAFFAWLFLLVLGEPLVRLARWLAERFQPPTLEDAPPLVEQNPITDGDAGQFITSLAASATWVMALIPIVVLIGMLLFIQRRRRKPITNDEQRVSLGLVDGLASDLRGMLAGLRNPFAQAQHRLQTALGNLSRNDPTSRVRRAYIQLLLGLERRQIERPANTTPHEFAEQAQQRIAQQKALHTITAAYEAARYNPSGATEQQATSAETALQQIRNS